MRHRLLTTGLLSRAPYRSGYMCGIRLLTTGLLSRAARGVRLGVWGVVLVCVCVGVGVLFSVRAWRVCVCVCDLLIILPGGLAWQEGRQ